MTGKEYEKKKSTDSTAKEKSTVANSKGKRQYALYNMQNTVQGKNSARVDKTLILKVT